MSKTLAFMGDSITENLANAAVTVSAEFTRNLEEKLRKVGFDVLCRNFGNPGDRTNTMINRFNIMGKYSQPDIGFIEGGINNRNMPTVTPSGTGGSISTGSNLYFGILLVFNNANGGAVSLQGIPQVFNFSGTTSVGSIALATMALGNSGDTNYDVYTTPTTYADAATAAAVPVSSYKLAANGGAISGVTFPAVTLTALGNGAAPPVGIDTKAHYQAMIKALKFKAFGAFPLSTGSGCAVYSQTNLPAGNYFGKRYVVMNDSSSTGGAAKTQSTAQLDTITGSVGNTQTVWEWRYPAAGEAGWGRVATVATVPTYCKNIVLIGTHYLNYASNGDTLATPYAPYDDVTGLRAIQKAAVAAEEAGHSGNVTYGDLYKFLRDRIVAGLDVQGDEKWQAYAGNLHFSAYGNELVAEFLYNLIQGNTTLLNSIS